MGNSKSGVEFAINLDKQFYFSSETVKGNLFINTSKRFPASKIILQIEGVEKCAFRTLQGTDLTGEKQLMLTKFVLAEFRHG